MDIDNAECAPPEIRGMLVGLQQFSIEFGIMISFWIDYGTNYIGGTGVTQSDAAWLVPLCLQLFPALILFTGIIFMPFSPRWLVHHGREDEARRVLATLRGKGVSVDNEAIEVEFLEIKAQSMFEKRSVQVNFPHLAEQTPLNTFKLQFVAIASLFRTMPMFRRVIVSTVTMFFQQWTGINAVLYYAPTIFKNLGMSSNTTSLLATGVVGIGMFAIAPLSRPPVSDPFLVMLVTTIPMIMYVDKIGRKPVLISGAVAMGVCHLIIAVIFAKNQYQWPTHQSAGWAAIVMVWLFAANFGWSWGPCAWIIVAEVWPLSARPYGIALGASSNWMNNFIVGQVTPDMISGMAYGTFIFFGLLTLLGSVFIYFFVPETKQLTLEEMDVIFGSAGVAAAEKDRLDQIHRELGLTSSHDADVGEDKVAKAE
jgi:sugar porter (SP) family MFS transporter